jgi:hypothetical protein
MATLMDTVIFRACRGTETKSLERTKALAGVRWVLATDDGRFVKLSERLEVMLTHVSSEATVYDGRDNEEMKCRFMQTVLGVSLSVVLLDE